MNEDLGYVKGVNQFSDMSDAEFERFKGLKIPKRSYTGPVPISGTDISEQKPIDWVKSGAVTSVKN